MHTLYLDIETIPTQRPDVRVLLAAGIKPPGNISKAESIAAWEAEKRPLAVEETVASTALEGAFGQIICICWAFNAGPVQTAIAPDTSLAQEAQVLHTFFNAMPRTPARLKVVGHNVAAFDLRFIRQRAMIHGIKAPPYVLPFDAKPWDDCIFDTMVQWAGVGKTISMDKLCLAFGLAGKGEMDGSKVWPAIKAGEFAKVAAYCRDDVERTRLIHQRMTFAESP
jgi:predicted PolB exonuclease-like 3'-5' exonuclease